MNNLVDMKFGKLLVIKKTTNIIGKNREYGAWECLCDCGNIKIVSTYHLNRGSVKSCGCLYDIYGKSLFPGEIFTRLTTVSYNKINGKWLCKCICNNMVNVKTDVLNSGNTKSCGCLKTDNLSARSNKLIAGRRKFEPRIASARRVWKSYCYRDNKCIDFDNFMILSQQNCFYCGVFPSNNYNYFLTKSAKGSKKAKLEGLFVYNGIDRIDSNKSHTLDNIVTACMICNRAKNDRTVGDFLSWIKNLKIIPFQPIDIIKISFPTNGSLATSIKCVFYNHKKNTDLTIKEYYSISQMNCFYCNNTPSNSLNSAKNDKKSSIKAKENGNYIYNGIDRIDTNLLHNKNNIVPCCYYCNFAKNKLSIFDFQFWINRIQQFQKQKELDFTPALLY